MFIQATISCQCSCIFEEEFQTSTENNAPKCPQCGNVMSYDSWKHLRSIMADLYCTSLKFTVKSNAAKHITHERQLVSANFMGVQYK